MILTKYKHLQRAHNIYDAIELYNSGHTLFYSNGNTERAELRETAGAYYFQYESGAVKFNSESLNETLDKFFRHKGSGKRFLYVEKRAAPPTVDDEDFGITITVPKGTKVKIIEI